MNAPAVMLYELGDRVGTPPTRHLGFEHQLLQPHLNAWLAESYWDRRNLLADLHAHDQLDFQVWEHRDERLPPEGQIEAAIARFWMGHVLLDDGHKLDQISEATAVYMMTVFGRSPWRHAAWMLTMIRAVGIKRIIAGPMLTLSLIHI